MAYFSCIFVSGFW